MLNDPPDKQILFEAFDYDEAPKTDDDMGFIQFKVNYFIENPQVRGWFKLQPPLWVNNEEVVEKGRNFVPKSITKRRVEKLQELMNLKGEIELEFVLMLLDK